MKLTTTIIASAVYTFMTSRRPVILRHLRAAAITIILLTLPALSFGYGAHEFTAEAISALSAAELASVNSAIPPSHPRIFLKAAELQALKARVGIGRVNDYDLGSLRWRGKPITFGEMAAEYNAIKFLAEKYKNDPDGMRKAVDPNLKQNLLGWPAAAFAFVNLLEPDASYLTSAKYLLDLAVNNPQTKHAADGGEQVYPVAIAYDWIANSLNKEEKLKYIKYMLDQVEQFGFVGKSSGHFPKLNDLSNLNPATGLRALYAGIAIFNDMTGNGEINTSNSEAIKIIRDYGGFFRRVVNGFKMAGGTSGGYYEDFGHTSMALDNILCLVELWYQATGENLYKGFKSLEFRHLLNYMTAKPNGTSLFSNYVKFNNYRIKPEYLLIANQYNSSTIQSMAELSFLNLNDGFIWKEILWKDAQLTVDTTYMQHLPKEYLFDTTGMIFFRSGWNFGEANNPSEDLWGSIYCGRFFPTHKWYMMNSFSLFYKGDLIVNNSLDGPNKPTKYHNTIMIDNKNQREISSTTNIIGWKNFDKDTDADLSRITNFENSNQHIYARGESSLIYDPTILNHWSREYIYLKKQSSTNYYFITFDNVITNQDYTNKKNMINTYNPPRMDGELAVSGATYATPNTIQVDVGGNPALNLNGRAFVTIALPTETQVLAEEIASNATIDQRTAKPKWSVYIEPTNPSKQNNFLNVIQICDSYTNTKTDIDTITYSFGNISTDAMTGVQIKDSTENKFVLFKSTTPNTANPESISYSGTITSDTSRHYIFGMIKGKMYDIKTNIVNGKLQINISENGSTLVASTNGSLIFSLNSSGSLIANQYSKLPPPTITKANANNGT